MDLLLRAAVDEVAAEGVAGCPLPQLWAVLQPLAEQHVGHPLQHDRAARHALWGLLLRCPGIVALAPAPIRGATPFLEDSEGQEPTAKAQQTPLSAPGQPLQFPHLLHATSARALPRTGVLPSGTSSGAVGRPSGKRTTNAAMGAPSAVRFQLPVPSRGQGGGGAPSPEEVVVDVEEAEVEGVLLLACHKLRDRALGLYEESTVECGLNAIMVATLQHLARARHRGASQAQLARELRVKNNNFHYVLRTLEARGLIVSHEMISRDPATGSPCRTNILHLARYASMVQLKEQQRFEIVQPGARPGLQGSEQAQGDMGAGALLHDCRTAASEGAGGDATSLEVSDDLPALATICQHLEGAEGKVLVRGELKASLGYRFAQGHRAWRRLQRKLEATGMMEAFEAKVDGKVVTCVRLLRDWDEEYLRSSLGMGQKSAPAPDAGASPGARPSLPAPALLPGAGIKEEDEEGLLGPEAALDADDGGVARTADLITELSLEQQVVDEVERAGADGILQPQVATRVGLPKKRFYRMVAALVESGLLSAEPESVNRTTVYRLRVRAPALPLGLPTPATSTYKQTALVPSSEPPGKAASLSAAANAVSAPSPGANLLLTSATGTLGGSAKGRAVQQQQHQALSAAHGRETYRFRDLLASKLVPPKPDEPTGTWALGTSAEGAVGGRGLEALPILSPRSVPQGPGPNDGGCEAAMEDYEGVDVDVERLDEEGEGPAVSMSAALAAHPPPMLLPTEAGHGGAELASGGTAALPCLEYVGSGGGLVSEGLPVLASKGPSGKGGAGGEVPGASKDVRVSARALRKQARGAPGKGAEDGARPAGPVGLAWPETGFLPTRPAAGPSASGSVPGAKRARLEKEKPRRAVIGGIGVLVETGLPGGNGPQPAQMGGAEDLDVKALSRESWGSWAVQAVEPDSGGDKTAGSTVDAQLGQLSCVPAGSAVEGRGAGPETEEGRGKRELALVASHPDDVQLLTTKPLKRRRIPRDEKLIQRREEIILEYLQEHKVVPRWELYKRVVERESAGGRRPGGTVDRKTLERVVEGLRAQNKLKRMMVSVPGATNGGHMRTLDLVLELNAEITEETVAALLLKHRLGPTEQPPWLAAAPPGLAAPTQGQSSEAGAMLRAVPSESGRRGRAAKEEAKASAPVPVLLGLERRPMGRQMDAIRRRGGDPQALDIAYGAGRLAPPSPATPHAGGQAQSVVKMEEMSPAFAAVAGAEPLGSRDAGQDAGGATFFQVPSDQITSASADASAPMPLAAAEFQPATSPHHTLPAVGPTASHSMPEVPATGPLAHDCSGLGDSGTAEPQRLDSWPDGAAALSHGHPHDAMHEVLSEATPLACRPIGHSARDAQGLDIRKLFGYVPARMVRARLLHCFLWSVVRDQREGRSIGAEGEKRNPQAADAVGASLVPVKQESGRTEALLPASAAHKGQQEWSKADLSFVLKDSLLAMPLQVFLQVVGVTTADVSMDFLEQRALAGCLVSELPRSVQDLILNSTARARASVLLRFLFRLKLVNLELQEDAEAEEAAGRDPDDLRGTMGAAVMGYTLNRELRVQHPASLELRRQAEQGSSSGSTSTRGGLMLLPTAQTGALQEHRGSGKVDKGSGKRVLAGGAGGGLGPQHGLMSREAHGGPIVTLTFDAASDAGLATYWDALQTVFTRLEASEADRLFPANCVSEVMHARMWSASNLMTIQQRKELMLRLDQVDALKQLQTEHGAEHTDAFQQHGAEPMAPMPFGAEGSHAPPSARAQCEAIAADLGLSVQQVQSALYQRNAFRRWRGLQSSQTVFGASALLGPAPGDVLRAHPAPMPSLPSDLVDKEGANAPGGTWLLQRGAEAALAARSARKGAMAEAAKAEALPHLPGRAGTEPAASVGRAATDAETWDEGQGGWRGADEEEEGDEEDEMDVDDAGDADEDAAAGPGRSTRALWTELSTRSLLELFARFRAAQRKMIWLGRTEQQQRLLPHSARACRRHIAGLRSDPSTRLAIASLCSLLARRYASWLEWAELVQGQKRVQEEHARTGDGAEGPAAPDAGEATALAKHLASGSAADEEMEEQNEEQDDPASHGGAALGPGQELQPRKRRRKRSRVDWSAGARWDDFEDPPVRAAVDRVLHCYYSLRPWLQRRRFSGRNARPWMLAQHPGLAQTASGASNAPGDTNEGGRPGAGAGPAELEEEAKVQGSLRVSTAVELVKAVVLNADNEGRFPETLVKALREFSDAEVVEAFQFLRHRGILVPGKGARSYDLNPLQLGHTGASRIPQGCAQDAHELDTWLQEHHASLESEGLLLPSTLRFGHTLRVLSQAASGILHLAPEATANLANRPGDGPVGLADEEGPTRGSSRADSPEPSRRVRGFPELRVRLTRRAYPHTELLEMAGPTDGASEDGRQEGEAEDGEMSADKNQQEDHEAKGEAAPGGVDGLAPRSIEGGSDGRTTVTSGAEEAGPDWADPDDGEAAQVLLQAQQEGSEAPGALGVLDPAGPALGRQAALLRAVLESVRACGRQGCTKDQLLADVAHHKAAGEGTVSRAVEWLLSFGFLHQVPGFSDHFLVAAEHASCYSFAASVPEPTKLLPREPAGHDGSSPEALIGNHGAEAKTADAGSLQHEPGTSGAATSAQPAHLDSLSVVAGGAATSPAPARATSALALEQNEDPRTSEDPRPGPDLGADSAAPQGAQDTLAASTEGSRAGEDEVETVRLRPWLRPDGSVHSDMFKTHCRKLMGVVFAHPGVPENVLLDLCPAMNPQTCKDLLEVLEAEGALRVRSYWHDQRTERPDFLKRQPMDRKGEPAPPAETKHIGTKHYFLAQNAAFWL